MQRLTVVTAGLWPYLPADVNLIGHLMEQYDEETSSAGYITECF
jgi:hypothetical protein